MPSQLTPRDLKLSKGQRKLATLTAYDYPTARILDEAGIDLILVGDSLGNVVYGWETTLPVTMEDMLRHTQAVSRAVQRACVVADMPFGSYQPSPVQAVENACRFLAEGGAHAVKLEGGRSQAETITRLVDCGIPVMAHVGLTPQSVNQLGGYRMCGKTEEEAEAITQDALAVCHAGAFCVVLECVQAELAARITQEIPIPTIGIGSGNDCDGQILVINDLIGHNLGHVPKFVKVRANVRGLIHEAVLAYIKDIS